MGDAMIRGKQADSIVDVDPVSGSLKVTLRPGDVLGSYFAQAITGTMAAALAAGSPIVSFRWGTDTGYLALIRRIRISMNSLTGFTAGVGRFDAFIARAFSASDSGGAAINLTGNQAKRRTSFATSIVTSARISTTDTLTAGTRTLDALPLIGYSFVVPTTANYVIIPTFDLWLPGNSDWPVVFSHDEGLVIQATVPATGTWNFQIGLYWDEVTAF